MNYKSFLINVSCTLLLSGCTHLTVDSDDTSNATSSYDNGHLEQDEKVKQHEKLRISSAKGDLSNSDKSPLLIPDEISSFLSKGVSVSAFVSNLESGVISKHSFGDIIVSYHDESIWLDKVESINNEFPLTENAQSSLLELKDVKFDSSGRLVLSDLISMHLDIESMEITVNVDPSLMAVSNVKEHETILNNSSVNHVTDLLSYSVYSNSMHSSIGTSRRDNIRFDNVLSWQEHHINTSGFISNNTDDEQQIELDDLTYEYDAKGYRFDVGMKSGWSSVQSLGDVTTLNGQKVYGGSFGNVAKSAKYNSRQALVPLIVYMPGNGEAKVFRDGRLLDIQRLEMGNKELDTENFPVGVYDVDVEVSVGGRTVSKRTYQVNKPAGSTGSHGSGLSWQLWGGMMEQQEVNYVNVQEEDVWGEYQQSTRMASLVGFSIGSNWRGVNWAATAYNNDKTQVSEWHADWNIANNYTLYTQVLAATDGATGILARGDATFFDGQINLWLASERKHAGSRVTAVYDTSLDSTGASLSLYEATEIPGALSITYQQDHEYDTRYWSADYSHSLNFEDFGSWILQVGTNKQYAKNDYGDSKVDQYYASLSVSLPFDGNFTLGVSKNGDSDVYNLSGSTNIDMGPVTYIGTDISMNRTKNIDTVTSYGGYLGYDTRYLDGSLSYSGSKSDSSVSLSGRGAVAIDHSGISAGSGHGDAAIIVDVSEDIEDGALIATVNQAPHELHDGRNLLLVPAYNTYDVNVSNNLESDKSYQVDIEDKSKYTLYPGNVAPLTIHAKEMMTVFGRLRTSEGESLANISVKNHIGMTTTDTEGNFAIDVDSAFPEIIVEVANDHKYKVEMTLVNQDGTAMVGDILLNGPSNETYKVKPV